MMHGQKNIKLYQNVVAESRAPPGWLLSIRFRSFEEVSLETNFHIYCLNDCCSSQVFSFWQYERVCSSQLRISLLWI